MAYAATSCSLPRPAVRCQSGARSQAYRTLSASARRAYGAVVCTACSSSGSPNASSRMTEAPSDNSDVMVVQRRALLAGASLAATCGWQPLATADELRTYADQGEGFTIQVPAGWETGLGYAEGSGLADRKVIAFYPPGKPQTNVNIVITNVAADFTRMGSFGDAYTFGFNLVGSLDRSGINNQPKWIANRVSEKPPGQEAILEDAKERNGIYYIEYTIASDYDMSVRDYEKKDRFLSAVAIGNNGIYNRLFTVTAQFQEAEKGDFYDIMKAAVQSFVPPKSVF